MTSNIGSAHLLEGLEEDGSIKEESRELVMGQLRGHFRPEFLNRVMKLFYSNLLQRMKLKVLLIKL